MKASSLCVSCILRKADQLYEEHRPSDPEKINFLKEVRALLHDAPSDASAPKLSKLMLTRLKRFVDLDVYYQGIKNASNGYMLQWESTIRKRIQDSLDPIRTALSYAIIGNFIDFGAMNQVDEGQLEELIQKGDHFPLDPKEYEAFQKDLKNATRMVYLLDNAGEIVFDKLFMETMKKHCPQLDITAVVRGFPVYNDATLSDGIQVGLPGIVHLIDNGAEEPGTELDQIDPALLDRLRKADFILAKGQGNFESLQGCGLHIYYGFLCKCVLFTQRFQMEKYAGVFIRESSLLNPNPTRTS